MYAEASVIYADILFVINFSLDFLCLFITSRLLNCASGTIRLILGAVLGGAYSFLPYIFDLWLPLHLIAAGIICLIAFGRQDLKKFLVITLTFIVSSALLGGLVTSLYSLSGSYSNGIYTEINALSFALICLFSAVIALSYGLICRKKINTQCAEARIYAENKKISVRLLADSGNLVTEPFSALPVIIVSSAVMPYPYDNPESEIFPLAVRAIPFRTTAGEGCYFGFRPHKIEILRLGKKPKTVDAYVAIDTMGHTYSGYDGIIPTSIL